MFKKVAIFVFSGLLLLNIYGCFALLAGATGGVGTAAWLSGKVSQEFQSSYAQTTDATKAAMRSLRLKTTKETKEEDITQIKSEYTDGKDIWIDIRKITDNSTKVEVRVGGIKSDKAIADKILETIQKYLPN
jgi:galactitol-specific phosphotransferase system IIB component